MPGFNIFNSSTLKRKTIKKIVGGTQAQWQACSTMWALRTAGNLNASGPVTVAEIDEPAAAP